MEKHTETTDWFTDGMTEFMANNFGASVELLTRVLETDPDHKIARVSRGAAFLKMDRLNEAIDDFNRVVEQYPEYARAFHLRGLARDQQGDHDGALEDFGTAIDLDPEYGAAYYSRVTLLTKLGREEEAMDDIQMVNHITNRNIEEFANENNLWRSQQLRLEATLNG